MRELKTSYFSDRRIAFIFKFFYPVKLLENIMYYTYVLQSEVDINFYVGITKDLKQRFDKHNKGLVDSTKDNRRPLKLAY